MPRHVWRRAMGSGVTWCAIGRIAGAQLPGIAIDPHIVVLSPARRAGEITVFNPRNAATDFTLDLRFGFTTTDSTGVPQVALADGDASNNAAPWTAAYPHRFRLRAGASQTVRLLARPPAALPDGEYWARLTVHATDAPDDSVPGSAIPLAAPSLRLALETATVLPVFYRKGAVATGVAVDSLSVEMHDSTISVRPLLRRTGSGAFLGVATVRVHDGAGRLVGTTVRQLAVYRTSAPRWTVRIAEPGAYRVTVELTTDRRDVERSLVLSATPVVVTRDVAPRAETRE